MVQGYVVGVEEAQIAKLATATRDGLIGALRTVRGTTTVTWLLAALRSDREQENERQGELLGEDRPE